MKHLSKRLSIILFTSICIIMVSNLTFAASDSMFIPQQKTEGFDAQKAEEKIYEYESELSEIVDRNLSKGMLIYELNGLIEKTDHAQKEKVTYKDEIVKIDNDDYIKTTFIIPNVEVFRDTQLNAGTIAQSVIVCFAPLYNQEPYGNSTYDQYYSVYSQLLGYYNYYYDSLGQKYVCPYSMNGKNTIIDPNFYVYSQYATNTYSDGGTIIGSTAYSIGGDLDWWRFPNYSQFVLANYFTVLQMTNTVTVKRGTSLTYSFPVFVADNGTD